MRLALVKPRHAEESENMKNEKPSRLARGRIQLAISIIRLSVWGVVLVIKLIELLSMALYYRSDYDATMERSLPGQAWKMGIHTHPRNA